MQQWIVTDEQGQDHVVAAFLGVATACTCERNQQGVRCEHMERHFKMVEAALDDTLPRVNGIRHR